MVKRFLAVMPALCAALLLCACSSMFAEEYYYSEHYSENAGSYDLSGIQVQDYFSLKSAITQIVSSHGEHGRLIFSNYSGSLSDDLSQACFEIKSQTPIGAFAVDTLSYETSRIVSYYTADIYVTYLRSKAEVESIRGVNGTQELRTALAEALSSFSDVIILRYNSSQADAQYIEELVDDVYESDPLLAAREPRLEVSIYPETGVARIIELRFSYDLGRNELFLMRREQVGRAQEIAAMFSEGEDWSRAVGCALYLSQTGTPAQEGTAGTVYDALVLSSADSKGLALAYSALCDMMGIECVTVEGSVGMGGTEPHFWNIVKLGEDYYHMDVSLITERGPQYALLLSDENIWGEYLWDIESFPACTGALTYDELYGEEQGEDGEDGENGGNGESGENGEDGENGENGGTEEGGQNGEGGEPPVDVTPTVPPAPDVSAGVDPTPPPTEPAGEQ